MEKLLKKNTVSRSKPTIFNLSISSQKKELSALIKKGAISHITDEYKSQLREYFEVSNPTLVYSKDFNKEFNKYLKAIEKERALWQQGRWVYYPWISTLCHVMEEDAFYKVRTARNRNLITEKEQSKFYNIVVGIAGLSVGNSIALAIVLEGGAKHIKLADHDNLELSNLNRIRTGVNELGLNKAEMTAREIYLINPYAKVELFKNGLHKKNISKFFKGKRKLDIVIDEIDAFGIKYLIREQAKKMRIPVLMAADNGDNGIIDIERYDLSKNTKFFNGRIGKVTYKKLNELNKFEIGKTIIRLIGHSNIPERVFTSFAEMGKTLVSWPQLGSTALLNGAVISYCVRKIVSDLPLEKKKAILSIDEKLIPGYNNKKEIEKRFKTSNKFAKLFNI